MHVHDLNVELYTSSDKKPYWDFDASYYWNAEDRLQQAGVITEKVLERWTSEILANSPSLICISVHDHSYITANKLVNKIREQDKEAVIVFGGPICSPPSLEYYGTNPNVDAYICGEGEVTISRIVEDIQASKKIKLKPGVMMLNGSGKLAYGGYPPLADIDSIPYPAFDALPLGKYLDKTRLPILFSRGCSFGCNFCMDRYFWNKHRIRSPQNILGEIKKHQDAYGVHVFNANDIILNERAQTLHKIASAFIEDGLHVTWGGMARVMPMPEETLRTLKKAGCEYFTIGIESGSQKVLDDMRKGLTVRQAEEFLKKVHAAGIETYSLFMVGYPTEGAWDFAKTLWFIWKNKRHISNVMHVGTCEITPETELYLRREELGIVWEKGDWSSGKTTRRIRNRRLKVFNTVVPWLAAEINKL